VHAHTLNLSRGGGDYTIYLSFFANLPSETFILLTNFI
jgi:hypothetical protein